MTRKEKIEKVLAKYQRKIGNYEIYPKPKTVINPWAGKVRRCVARIEVLGLSGGSSEVSSDLRAVGLIIQVIGLDIYVSTKPRKAKS